MFVGKTTILLAAPCRDWRDAMRALSELFPVTVGPPRVESRVYLDTFDWRLFRAGLQLVRAGDELALADAATGVTLAQGSWPHRAPPRFAREIPAEDLRALIEPVTAPRALLAAASAQVWIRTIEVRNRRGGLVAGLRAEAATGTYRGRRRTLHGLLFDSPLDETSRARARSSLSVTRALAGAGFRPVTASWFEIIARAAGCAPGDHPARPRVPVDRETAARTAVSAVFLHLYGAMLRNESGVMDDVDSEFLHDYRVALRRTRTGLAELKGVLPAESERSFRERFRTLSDPTSVLRDFDVQLLREERYRSLLPEDLRAGLDPLYVSMKQARAAAWHRVADVLGSRAHRSLMRDWKRALDALARDGAAGPRADERALDVAREAIGKRHGRIRDAASSIENLDDPVLHRVRIDCKKLRYLLEFFEVGLHRRTASVIADMQKLQDALGEFHDLGVHARSFRDALHAIGKGQQGSPDEAAALGGIIALLEGRRRKVRRRCERRLRKFAASVSGELA